MFWNKKTPEEKKTEGILRRYEAHFHFEKDSLSKTHVPTENLVKLVCNPPEDAKKMKELKESCMRILGSIGKANTQELESFLKVQK